MGLASVVPIILNCYVGHQSVHGIMGMLKPYTPGGSDPSLLCYFRGWGQEDPEERSSDTHVIQGGHNKSRDRPHDIAYDRPRCGAHA